MSAITTSLKTIFLLFLWLGLATSRLIEIRQSLDSSSSSSSSSSSLECVINLQEVEDDEDDEYDTTCQRRLNDGTLTDEYYDVELPEMIELLYEDEIEQGSLVISIIADGDIEDDEVVWSDFKVLEPSNVILCRIIVMESSQQDNEENAAVQTTECIPIEHGIERRTHMYQVKLPEEVTTQFEQAIQDGVLYLSMTGATIQGDHLIVPDNESDIKVLVLEAQVQE